MYLITHYLSCSPSLIPSSFLSFHPSFFTCRFLTTFLIIFFLHPCFHQFISACCLCIRTQFLPAKQMATHSHQTRTRQFWTQKHNASYLSQMLSKLIVITCNAWPVEVTSTRTLLISYSKMHVTKLPLYRTMGSSFQPMEQTPRLHRRQHCTCSSCNDGFFVKFLREIYPLSIFNYLLWYIERR